MERLDKFLCDCGAGTRSQVKAILKSGRVTVDGRPEKDGSRKLDPTAVTVCLDGEPLGAPGRLVVMLNKPAGYVTTSHDQFGRPDVTQLVDIPGVRLYPVGRLDYQTTGLLLLTNDGDLAFQLTHPGNKVPKVYRALVRGEIKSEELHRMETGVVLDDGYKTAKAKARLVSRAGTNSKIEVTIYEGKNHQVRRMAKAVGHPVLRLERVAEGPLELGNLKEGEYRVLTPAEVKMLKSFK